MRYHSRFFRYSMPTPRNPERCRTRALDECDEWLDDWMVACPAADLARSE